MQSLSHDLTLGEKAESDTNMKPRLDEKRDIETQLNRFSRKQLLFLNLHEVQSVLHLLQMKVEG